MSQSEAYKVLQDQLVEQGIDVEAVKAALKKQHVETPSWGYGDSGTRFKMFPYRGAARNVYEKLQDAGFIHRLTGIAPSVAIHIPWDRVDDFEALRQFALDQGVSLGAVNPNLFQSDDYMLGSVCHPDASVRRKALDHMLECVRIMQITGSRDLSLWFADGTNYAGQDSIRGRKRRLEETLKPVADALGPDHRMLIEYKFFEPAFYQTDLADWGMAAFLAQKMGPGARVLVDTGHHAPGTNIEHIVAFLLSEGLLGGFHLNNRKYADDDLIVGSVNPFELFLIYNELAGAAAGDDPVAAETSREVAYMIDQSHNIEPRLEAMLVSVLNCQTAYARALLVDRKKLAEQQAAHDVLGGHRVLVEAFETDVRPLLRQVRAEMGLDPDPLHALRTSGYVEKVAEERGIAKGASGGFMLVES